MSRDDLSDRRTRIAERADLERRRVKLQNEIKSLPPREQLRLAADFAEKGQVRWAIQIGQNAIKRLSRGDLP